MILGKVYDKCMSYRLYFPAHAYKTRTLILNKNPRFKGRGFLSK